MPTIISVASGKGGVGKSMVVSNLGLLLARKGHRVILVDMDIGGANLHILFGMFHPPSTLTDFFSNRSTNLEDLAHPLASPLSLRLIPGTGETLITANLQHAKKKRLIRHLQKLDADIILVDVGAGTSYHTLDFFLLADYFLAVATPDPTSVLDLYRFIKLAAIRKVLTVFLARDPIAETLLSQDFHSVTEVLEAVGRTSESGVELAQQALHGFQPALILNRMTSEISNKHPAFAAFAQTICWGRPVSPGEYSGRSPRPTVYFEILTSRGIVAQGSSSHSLRSGDGEFIETGQTTRRITRSPRT